MGEYDKQPINPEWPTCPIHGTPAKQIIGSVPESDRFVAYFECCNAQVALNKRPVFKIINK